MRHISPGLILLGCSTLPFSVQAHVNVVSEPVFANQSGIIELAVPHGCTVGDAHLDTARIEVTIPASLTGLRPVYGEMGNVSISTETLDIGTDTKLVWSKPTGTLLDTDTHYYSVKFRAKMPDAPFSQIPLPTTQFCLNNGEEVSVHWDQISEVGHEHNNTASDNKPAPLLTVYPQRFPGWNQYTTAVDQHLHDMSIFSDAEIVWWNEAAFSPNPSIQTLIEADVDVTTLNEIHDNATFWVKY